MREGRPLHHSIARGPHGEVSGWLEKDGGLLLSLLPTPQLGLYPVLPRSPGQVPRQANPVFLKSNSSGCLPGDAHMDFLSLERIPRPVVRVGVQGGASHRGFTQTSG